MSYNKRPCKGTAAAALIILTVALFMIIPRMNRANPIPEQILITEFSVQPSAGERIELYLVNVNEYNLEQCFVETDHGAWQFLPGLDYPDSGFVILTDSSVVGDLELNDSGGFIRIFDEYFEWALVYYGDHAESSVPAPGTSHSASAGLRVGEYDWLTVDYYYLDSSPTFGEWNDLEGSFGIVRGTVTDSSTGVPIEGATVVPSDSLHSTITNSVGFFELDVVSGFPTLCVTASGYNPHLSDFREITLYPDSTIPYDVQLAPGSGIETPDPGGQPAPRSFTLSQNYPNPFNPSTIIHFEIRETVRQGEQTSLVIFDTRGRLVRTLINEGHSAGRYEVHWDGTDEYGRKVGSGVYLYRLQVGSYQSTRRMVVLR